MPEVHAKLSASGSHRWLTCPRSVALEAYFPNETSVYAQEGTVAHELCELTGRYYLNFISEDEYENAVDALAKKYPDFYCEEMREHANAYASFVRNEFEAVHSTCDDPIAAFETRLDFSDYVPAGFGTGDCVIIAEPCMEIIDFKYGRGTRVEAENNSQMMLYALGALAVCGTVYDIKSIKMTIFQPRIPNGVTSFEMSTGELIEWGTTVVQPAAKLAMNDKGDFHPSEEACRFCKARRQCKARADQMLAAFDQAAAMTDKMITADEAGAILEKLKGLDSFVEDLKKFVSDELMTGKPVTGWKLVEGKSNRKLTEPAKVVEVMTAAGYNEALLYKRELLSLTQLERDFGKKEIAKLLGDYIVKPKGAPTLVPSTDKREPWTPAEALLAAFDEGGT